jgi:hypothetical protein
MPMRLPRTTLGALLAAGALATGLAAGAADEAAPAQTAAARPPADRLNFVGCPLVRDTSTVPCWLAEHEGELFYLGSQGSTSSAFYPPQLLHEVLVEASVGDGPRTCGGLPLTDVEVSVRPEITRACNTILPAEPRYTAPPSPPAPIRRFNDDTREFRVPYDFDSDYLTLHTTRILHEVVRIARLARPVAIDVEATRSAVLLSNGYTLVEREGLARERAEDVANILRGLGLADVSMQVSWRSDVERPDGVTDRTRRVTVIRLRDGGLAGVP